MNGMLTQGARELIATLNAAGLLAETDPRNLNPPCAWVSPKQIGPVTYADRIRITWDVYLIAPDTGDPLPHLQDLAAAAMDVFGVVEMTTTGITVANLSPDPLPALTLEVETETQR